MRNRLGHAGSLSCTRNRHDAMAIPEACISSDATMPEGISSGKAYGPPEWPCESLGCLTFVLFRSTAAGRRQYRLPNQHCQPPEVEQTARQLLFLLESHNPTEPPGVNRVFGELMDEMDCFKSQSHNLR